MLNSLIEMPVDIIFSVMQWLEPIDIFTLAVVLKTFNSFLSGDGRSIVINLLRRDPETPPCPPWYTEYDWAILLFGPNVCSFCGKVRRYKSLALNTYILRRICNHCDSPDKWHRQPDDQVEQNSIWDMMPYIHHIYEAYRVYWADDVRETQQKLDRLEENVKASLEGADLALNEFVKDRTTFVRWTRANDQIHTWVLRRWAHERIPDYFELKSYSGSVRFRLLELGYDKGDIKNLLRWDLFSIIDEHEFRLGNTISDWMSLFTKLQPLLRKKRKRRIALKRYNLVEGGRTESLPRITVLKAIYETFVSGLPAAQRPYAPVFQLVAVHAMFKHLHCGSLAESALDSTNLYPVEHMMPIFFDSWTSETRAALEADLPVHFHDDSEDPDASAGICLIDRVTAVFTAPGLPDHREKWIFIAWEELGILKASVRLNFSGLTFSQRGSIAAAAILTLSARRASNTLPSYLDKLDSRFVCLNCPIQQHGGLNGRLAFSWRECVRHFIHSDQATHKDPHWALLSPEAADDVRRRESRSIDQRDLWDCNHCAIYHRKYKRRREVSQHVRAHHMIDRPVDGHDLVKVPKPILCPSRNRLAVFAHDSPVDVQYII